jgi:hypothetical protein
MRRSTVTIGVFPAVIVVFTLASSCVFEKKHVAFTPPPPQAQRRIPTEVVRLPAPPEIDGVPNVPPAVPFTIQLGSVDAAPPDPRPVPRRNTNPTTPPHNTTPPPTVAETPTPPRLGPVFTAEQRRAYTRTLEESLERVKRALEFLATRNLNPQQADDREKISTFQRQAEQQREQDLVLAVNLAKRADLLAQDLVARVSQ